MLNIAILGPQASGKGTQARILADKYKLFYLEMGGILRKAAKEKTPLGKAIDEKINKKGELVSNDIVIRVVGKELKKLDREQGIVTDGIPRKTSQIELFENILENVNRQLDLVIFINIPESIIHERITKRRVCEKCKNIYRLSEVAKFKKIDNQRFCPECGGLIIHREDDKPVKIKRRLEIYNQETLPVIDFYRDKGILKEVDGSGSVEEVAVDIDKIVKNVL